MPWGACREDPATDVSQHLPSVRDGWPLLCHVLGATDSWLEQGPCPGNRTEIFQDPFMLQDPLVSKSRGRGCLVGLSLLSIS